MRISWNWLLELLPTKLSPTEAAALLTDIGLEVEAVYPYESIPGGLKGLIVGEVLTCIKHPDADKLKLCTVSIGSGDPLQIVCGAPNVAEKQKVIVATVGTELHPVEGEPFTIRKAKIRGVESNGMLCAEDEIGMGRSHAGLLLLPDQAQPGEAVTKYIPVYTDTILEIGLTANHADANAHYGVARELCAALQARALDEHITVKHPWKDMPAQEADIALDVEVITHEACKRYAGVVISDLQIGTSPDWMQHALLAAGMRPINNVVDITNYILLGLGQPLHAFDLQAIHSKKISVRTLPEGTKFTTLDNKVRNLKATDLMICDDTIPMCIAGVYGGIDSGVQENTTSIFLESAYFTPSRIRRTEAQHGLKTDASARFSKGTDPEMVIPALQWAAQLMVDLCGGKVSSPVYDIYPEPIPENKISFRYSRLYAIAAIEIPKETIRHILQALHIHILEETAEGLQLSVPVYKNDVLREIDITEEILRLYGFNKIPLPVSVRTPFTVRPAIDAQSIRRAITDHLVSNGMYELFTNAISRSKYTEKYFPTLAQEQVTLLNSLNIELDAMRTSMLFTGMEVIAHNLNRKQNDLRLFEFGRTYHKQKDKIDEREKIALYLTGKTQSESWDAQSAPVDFFRIKEYVQFITARTHAICTFEKVEEHPLLEQAAEIQHGDTAIGICGMVRMEIQDAFDIRQPVYFAELDWQALAGILSAYHISFSELPKYPEMRRDLALILEPHIAYAEIERIARQEGKGLLRDIVLFDIYTGEKLGGKKSYAIGLTFRDDARTLTDKDVDLVMQKLMARYSKDLNAEIRK